ncbi:GNAT family N-acetyltransferase [Paraburkholderia sp. HD33-4]|uniref:GNAT family N-acetyltransferase n=1 Tax=Paraburkholderia sp. HD33-4 TaxID=2883242 RepID=UPI001F32DA2B|nr:GNAT family protein [Paraburkholderia sp. HD33-4]
MVEISHPTLSDAQALLQFEVDNRAYFEHWINAREDSYYNIGSVRNAIEAAQTDIEGDKAYQFLVKCEGVIVGRVNLVGVVRPYFNKAVLGYRIGERFAGHGYASEAVRLVLETARLDLRLWRIEATVRPQNRASARVLERNGFVRYGVAKRSMHLHGDWHDLVHVERHLEGGH